MILMKKICFISILILCGLLSPYTALRGSEPDAINRLAGIDEFIEKELKDWNIPGLAVSIVKDKDVIYSKGFGFRDLNQKLQVTPLTMFPIASCTKAFTTTSLAILKGDGRFDWDTPVRKYIPSFRLKDEYATKHATTRDLVTHRVGLAPHDNLWWDSKLTRMKIFKKLQFLSFDRGFRESYEYNNLMYIAAGMVVEAVSGRTWEDFVRTKIFDPLEMKNTGFSLAGMKKSGDYSLPYRNKNGEIMENPYIDMTSAGPAGSINSNVSDMANWIIMNLNGGRFKDKQIIPEDRLNEIMKPQVVTTGIITEEEMFYKLYAMGWGINSYRGHLMTIHFGAIEGSRSVVAMLPKEKIGVVVLTNIEYSSIREIIAYRIFDRLLSMKEIDWSKRFHDKDAQAEADAEIRNRSKKNTISKKTQP